MAQRNIELKARLHDREKAIRISQKLGAQLEGDIHQRDTYFQVPTGRLKLRESDPGDDYLVFYRRPDKATAKGCDYTIAAVDTATRDVLLQSLDPLGVVDKVRTLYLWENIRIHLDVVTGLGSFIEFEAVLSEDHDDADGFAKVEQLQSAFGLRPEDIQKTSYLEMIHHANSGQANDL